VEETCSYKVKETGSGGLVWFGSNSYVVCGDTGLREGEWGLYALNSATKDRCKEGVSDASVNVEF